MPLSITAIDVHQGLRLEYFWKTQFMVLRFYGFMVLRFYGFTVLWFYDDGIWGWKVELAREAGSRRFYNSDR